ncbi:MAG: hypothetical protein WC683_13580 [bacterium]
MAWTAPRTWATGEIVTAAMLNTHVRDNELYLKGETDKLNTLAYSSPGGRALGTNYQNTSGKMMFISVTIMVSNIAANFARLNAYLGVASPPATTVAIQNSQADATTNGIAALSIMVPNGYYYKFDSTGSVVGAGSITLVSWYEWELH